MHGDGPTVMIGGISLVEVAALSLEQRIALVEQHLMTLLGVVHGIHEEIEREADDEHIDP